MQMYYPSRRQDLLVGSLVSTLLVSTVYWFGNGPHYVHMSGITTAAPPPEIIFHVPDPVTPVDIEDLAPQKLAPLLPPIMPQLQDVLRPVPPDSITQVVEPLHPDFTARDVAVIRNDALPGSGTRKVWESGSLDRIPSVRFQAPPHYPTSMIQSGMTGEVMVDFIVDPSGNVRNATAVRSSNREFESSAVDAVSKWKFRAGMKDGRPVFTHMQVPIEFSIRSD
jgi:protein TonB